MISAPFRNTLFALAAATSLALSCVTVTHAALIVHTNQTSFNTAVGAGLLTEDFNDDFGTGSPLNIVNSDLAQISSDANTIFEVGGGVVSIQGSASPVSWNTTFTFSSQIDAFGLLINDLFELTQETLSFQTSAGESGVLLTAGLLSNLNNQYLGITTDLAFSSITLSLTGGSGDGALLDNVGYSLASTAVPEPGVWMLMLAGGWFVRRRAAL